MFLHVDIVSCVLGGSLKY